MELNKIQIDNLDGQTLIQKIDQLSNEVAQLKKSVHPKDVIELLTRKEVAEFLGISLVTLHAWTKKGILKAYRIGNKVRYKKADVIASLQVINE